MSTAIPTRRPPGHRLTVGYHGVMSKLLLNLRDVPDDEADDVRAMLDERKIAFYETKPSFWGVSTGGIWIKHREDFAEAESLMAEYQRQRRTKARAEYHAAKREGTVKTVWDNFRESPLRVIAALLGMAFLIALMAWPFLLLRD